jgi:hypothetical protein
MSKDLEIQIRGNLALCQLNLNKNEECQDNCGRMLELEPNNAKGNFRMASAIFALNQKKSSLYQL